MRCKKCGAELHEDQKVCIRCGERTEAGFNFDYGDDKEHWRPSNKLIFSVSGVVVLIVIVIILVNVLTVTPPNEICTQWFTCMSEQNIKGAEKLMTPDFVEDKKVDESMQIDAQEYYIMINENKSKYKFSKPEIHGKKAEITIDIQDNASKNVTLSKIGRKWLVSDVK